MSLQIQDLSFIHPDGNILFQHLSFSVPSGSKCAIIGRNGCGKSTLLNVIAGLIPPTEGHIILPPNTYFIPQHFGQFDRMTVAEAIHVKEKIEAFHQILEGNVTEENFHVLNDDWEIEKRVNDALSKWLPASIQLDTPMCQLSGGEKTKVFLAGIDVHQPAVILMDEPTNHLDASSRAALYEQIVQSPATLLIVSHDRTLLNNLRCIYELSSNGIRYFPMPYDAYAELKQAESQSLKERLENQQKELNKAKRLARESIERQQKQNTRGEKRSEKKGVPRIAMGNLKDKAEATTSKLAKMQQVKLETMGNDIRTIRSTMDRCSSMQLDFHASLLHTGKVLIEVSGMNHAFDGQHTLWSKDMNVTIYSGNRIRLTGKNGSGKSTWVKIVSGYCQPSKGTVKLAPDLRIIYIDQEYSLLNNQLTVFEQLSQFNQQMQEHELKIRLNRFLFSAESWNKPCSCLSGGERMKLALCCLMVSHNAPDIIIADEPTNNIDIDNMKILAQTLRTYQGTLIVISHDDTFVNDIGIEKEIALE